MMAARRSLVRALMLAFVSTAASLPAPAQTAPAKPATAQPADQRFIAFLKGLWPRAEAHAVSRATFDAAITGLTPDPALMGNGTKQPEFERTIKDYLDGAVSAGRVGRGRAAAERYAGQLREVERRYGVPKEIVLAVWGMETDFGQAKGEKDVLRSLATLAYARKDETFAEEFASALEMVERGHVARSQLKGSWAGAMGLPQFMPSAYLTYAVSYSGGGVPDIWTSVPDALASIAHFLREQGWTPGRPWGAEVSLSPQFDWRTLTGSSRALAGLGVAPVGGNGPLPASDQATLFLPAGAGGPVLLLTENYWVIKQYNNSDSYAVAVAQLGERIAGRPGLQAPWPRDFRLLGRNDRIRIQEALRDRGLYDGKIDGRFGPASRDAIHRFQKSVGLIPADGFPSKAVLDRATR